MANEVADKIRHAQEILRAEGLNAFWLKGVDWFSWITGGASSTVILTNEIGVAEVLVTRDRAYVVCDEIEAPRMKTEELGAAALESFEILSFPWAEPHRKQELVQKALGSASKVASDRPVNDEKQLPQDLWRAKWRMSEPEKTRYRALGLEAAQSMREAFEQGHSQMTEFELAGLGARALLSRGIDPTLVLVAGQERLKKYRHPLPKKVPIGGYAMMVFCGRRFGLYANLTRYVAFGTAPSFLNEGLEKLANVELRGWWASRPGATLSQVYEVLRQSYAEIGAPGEIRLHHQGGLTGYLSREAVARPGLDIPLEANYAMAWNPSLPGVKLEDTILITEDGFENLSEDPTWPSFTASGVRRPLPLVVSERSL